MAIHGTQDGLFTNEGVRQASTRSRPSTQGRGAGAFDGVTYDGRMSSTSPCRSGPSTGWTVGFEVVVTPER